MQEEPDNKNGADPDVIDLDALVAKPPKVRLAGQTFEMPTVSTEQIALFMRAQGSMERLKDTEDENAVQALKDACDELDKVFPEIAERKPFAKLAPVQLGKILEIVTGLVAEASGGKSNRAERRARPKQARQRRARSTAR